MGSRLAITEKKPTKSRVFGSIFLHLLDWNKMLSKKKQQLFSNNKLLLPSVVKNFGGDEKMPTAPKHSMNADENLEKRSTSSQNQNGLCVEIRDPGPIAKLMGLDSMPIVHHNKHSQPSLISEFIASRPETSESRSLFSSSCEPLQSNRRARRQHHQKNSSSAESPRLLSKKNTSLLMEAATKILEPKASAKCTLAYMDSSQSHAKVSKGATLSKKYRVSSNDSVVGQSSSSFRVLNETIELRLRDREISVEEKRMKPPFIQAKASSMDVQANIKIERRVRGLYANKNRNFLRRKPLPPVKGKLVDDSDTCNKQSNRRGNVACERPRARTKELVRETADNKTNVVLERRRGSDVRSKNKNDKVASGTFVKSCSINGKGKRVISNDSINHSSSKSEFKNHVEGIRGSEENMADKRRFMDKLKPNCQASEKKIHSMASQREEMVQGDSLSEEKIEQLNSLDSNKFVKGDDVEGRSTASILGELISALRPGHEDSPGSDPTDIISDHTISNDEMVKAEERFQGEADDGNQPSPISILDVSFSNDSCCSASPHRSSVHQPDFESIDTCNDIRSLDLDTDLLDSASSFNMKKTTPDSLGANSVIEDIINQHEAFPSVAKILIDATSSSNFNGNDPFILDTLDSVTEALGLMSSAKVVNQLRKLNFDRMMEFLDSQFCNILKPETNLPLLMRKENLAIVVCNQIEGWNGLAGKAMDDTVEDDIRRSNGMWTKLKSEVYEIGVHIENDITNELVGEMVKELCI